MTVIVSKPAVNLREELASLRNQGGYQEQQFYFDGLVTNGTFDVDTNWTKGTGWTISGGTASKAAGSSSYLSQTSSLPLGKTYAFQFTVSGRTAGNVGPRLENAASSLVNSNGTYTSIITTNSANPRIIMAADSNFDGDVDNVSVFEVDANDDVVHLMPKGWVPKDVYEDGLLQREGSAHDYEVVYDGFDYYVKPTVAPSATTQTCVIGVKA